MNIYVFAGKHVVNAICPYCYKVSNTIEEDENYTIFTCKDCKIEVLIDTTYTLFDHITVNNVKNIGVKVSKYYLDNVLLTSKEEITEYCDENKVLDVDLTKKFYKFALNEVEGTSVINANEFGFSKIPLVFEKSDDNYNIANVKFDKDTIMFIKVDGCEIERQYYAF